MSLGFRGDCGRLCLLLLLVLGLESLTLCDLGRLLGVLGLLWSRDSGSPWLLGSRRIR